MLYPSNRRHVSKALSLDLRRLIAALCWVALLACLFLLVPDGVSAASTPGNDKPLPPLTGYDGLTRESLADLDTAPEPAPLAAASAATLQDPPENARARSIARRHRRERRHLSAPQEQPQVVVVKSAPRRNPAESFVYWWNGMVIRNFHTKFGTVFLDRIGAKT